MNADSTMMLADEENVPCVGIDNKDVHIKKGFREILSELQNDREILNRITEVKSTSPPIPYSPQSIEVPAAPSPESERWRERNVVLTSIDHQENIEIVNEIIHNLVESAVEKSISLKSCESLHFALPIPPVKVISPDFSAGSDLKYSDDSSSVNDELFILKKKACKTQPCESTKNYLSVCTHMESNLERDTDITSVASCCAYESFITCKSSESDDVFVLSNGTETSDRKVRNSEDIFQSASSLSMLTDTEDMLDNAFYVKKAEQSIEDFDSICTRPDLKCAIKNDLSSENCTELPMSSCAYDSNSESSPGVVKRPLSENEECVASPCKSEMNYAGGNNIGDMNKTFDLGSLNTLFPDDFCSDDEISSSLCVETSPCRNLELEDMPDDDCDKEKHALEIERLLAWQLNLNDNWDMTKNSPAPGVEELNVPSFPLSPEDTKRCISETITGSENLGASDLSTDNHFSDALMPVSPGTFEDLSYKDKKKLLFPVFDVINEISSSQTTEMKPIVLKRINHGSMLNQLNSQSSVSSEEAVQGDVNTTSVRTDESVLQNFSGSSLNVSNFKNNFLTESGISTEDIKINELNFEPFASTLEEAVRENGNSPVSVAEDFKLLSATSEESKSAGKFPCCISEFEETFLSEAFKDNTEKNLISENSVQINFNPEKVEGSCDFNESSAITYAVNDGNSENFNSDVTLHSMSVTGTGKDLEGTPFSNDPIVLQIQQNFVNEGNETNCDTENWGNMHLTRSEKVGCSEIDTISLQENSEAHLGCEQKNEKLAISETIESDLPNLIIEADLIEDELNHSALSLSRQACANFKLVPQIELMKSIEVQSSNKSNTTEGFKMKLDSLLNETNIEPLVSFQVDAHENIGTGLSEVKSNVSINSKEVAECASDILSFNSPECTSLCNFVTIHTSDVSQEFPCGEYSSLENKVSVRSSKCNEIENVSFNNREVQSMTDLGDVEVASDISNDYKPEFLEVLPEKNSLLKQLVSDVTHSDLPKYAHISDPVLLYLDKSEKQCNRLTSDDCMLDDITSDQKEHIETDLESLISRSATSDGLHQKNFQIPGEAQESLQVLDTISTNRKSESVMGQNTHITATDVNEMNDFNKASANANFPINEIKLKGKHGISDLKSSVLDAVSDSDQKLNFEIMIPCVTSGSANVSIPTLVPIKSDCKNVVSECLHENKVENVTSLTHSVGLFVPGIQSFSPTDMHSTDIQRTDISVNATDSNPLEYPLNDEKEIYKSSQSSVISTEQIEVENVVQFVPGTLLSHSVKSDLGVKGEYSPLVDEKNMEQEITLKSTPTILNEALLLYSGEKLELSPSSHDTNILEMNSGHRMPYENLPSLSLSSPTDIETRIQTQSISYLTDGVNNATDFINSVDQSKGTLSVSPKISCEKNKDTMKIAKNLFFMSQDNNKNNIKCSEKLDQEMSSRKNSIQNKSCDTFNSSVQLTEITNSSSGDVTHAVQLQMHEGPEFIDFNFLCSNINSAFPDKQCDKRCSSELLVDFDSNVSKQGDFFDSSKNPIKLETGNNSFSEEGDCAFNNHQCTNVSDDIHKTSDICFPDAATSSSEVVTGKGNELKQNVLPPIASDVLVQPLALPEILKHDEMPKGISHASECEIFFDALQDLTESPDLSSMFSENLLKNTDNNTYECKIDTFSTKDGASYIPKCLSQNPFVIDQMDLVSCDNVIESPIGALVGHGDKLQVSTHPVTEHEPSAVNDGSNNILGDVIEFSEEEFKSTDLVFKDPSDFEFIRTAGNIKGFQESQLARLSIFRNFDPLLSDSPKKEKSEISFEQIKIPEEVDDTAEDMPRFSTALFSSPGDNKTTTGIDVRDVYCSPEKVLKTFTEEELNRAIKIQNLLYEEKLINEEKEWQHKIQSVKQDIESTNNKIQLTNKCYETSRRNVVELENLLKSSMQRCSEKQMEIVHSNQKLREERDQALEDLRSVEKAFSDFVRRFESARAILETMKQNEKCGNQQIEMIEQKIEDKEKMIAMLHVQAEEKLEMADREVEAAKKSKEAETAVVKAMLRKADMKIGGLEKKLEQMVKENTELSSICDDLMAKVNDR